MSASDVAAQATHLEIVSSSFDIVWKLLQEKVYRPDKLVPGVTSVTIVHDGGPVEGVERKMIFPAKPNPEIHEIITWEQKEGPSRYCKVVFTMLSDPTLMGSVLNEAEEIDADHTRIWYTMDWRFRPEVAVENRKPPFPAGATMVGAVMHMKRACEAAAAAAATTA